MGLLPGAVALALLTAQPGTCVDAPTTGPELVEQAELCLAGLFAGKDLVRRDQRLSIAEKCPALGSALFDADVPSGWVDSMQDGTTAAQLQDFSSLLKGAHNRSSVIRLKPDFDRLEIILAETLEERREYGLWERFLRWLSEKLEETQESQIGRLFERLAGALPPAWLVEFIVKGALVLVLLLALAVVVNILRDEETKDWWRSMLGTRFRRPSRRNAVRTQGPSWSEIMALPPMKQVGAMLRLVIDDLSHRGLLAADRSRTNRELGRQLSHQHKAIAGLFSRFTRHAEPFLYGSRKPAQADLQQLREDARRLTISEPLTAPSGTGEP